MIIRSKSLARFGIALAFTVVIFAVAEAMSVRMWQPAFATGWILIGAMTFLTIFNARKKLPFMPLTPVRRWTQWHIYVGWFTVGLFLVHIEFRVPTGLMEQILAALFVIVAGSGIIGIFISRSFAQRLTRRGEEVIYERIGGFRNRLRNAANDLAAESVEATGSSTIADFYVERLYEWFKGPRDYFEHIFELNNRIYQFEHEFDEISRYLSDAEKEKLGELRVLVRKKYDLDYHHALQKTLKYWLFVHIPATYALMILAVVHLIMVHSFTGAMS